MNKSNTSSELVRQRAISDGFRDIFKTLNSSRPVTEVLDYILKRARKMVGADDVGIYQLETRRNELHLEPIVGMDAGFLTNLQIPVEGSFVAETVLNKRPLVIPDSEAIIARTEAVALAIKEKLL